MNDIDRLLVNACVLLFFVVRIVLRERDTRTLLGTCGLKPGDGLPSRFQLFVFTLGGALFSGLVSVAIVVLLSWWIDGGKNGWNSALGWLLQDRDITARIGVLMFCVLFAETRYRVVYLFARRAVHRD